MSLHGVKRTLRVDSGDMIHPVSQWVKNDKLFTSTSNHLQKNKVKDLPLISSHLPFKQVRQPEGK